MQSFSNTQNQALHQSVSSFATCWKLQCRNGLSLGFTDHDNNITYAETTYIAHSGFTPTALASRSDLGIDNMEVAGLLDASAITSDDIMAGVYDHAEVTIFRIDFANTNAEPQHLSTGWLGEITLHDGRFSAQLHGISQALNAHVGSLFSPTCRAQLGDSACGVDMSTRHVSGTLTHITSRAIIRDSARTEVAETFRYGLMTFTSGDNAGISREVRMHQSAGIFTLFLPLPYAAQAGDNYTITQGCDRTFSTCCTRFNNAINFRGEPHIPGLDKMFETSSTRN